MKKLIPVLIVLFATVAFAEGDKRSIDSGFSGGLNTPAGVGVEGIWRLDRIVALGAAAGYGSWGPRMSLIGRIHLENSIAQGLFVEPSLSLNLGGQRLAPADPAVPPVGNFTVAGGYRWTFDDRLWVVFRVGQSFSFGAPSSMQMPSSSGGSSAGDQFTRLMFRSDAPPSGWVLGLATGASI